MKTLRNPWFFTGILAWAIVILFRKLGHPLPFVNNYLGDLFAIPVIANLGLWFQRVFIIKNNYYVLGVWQVIFVVVYVSFIFEGMLPLVSKTYTADWIDVLLYIVGGIFFFEVMNRPVAEIRR
jgi:hypothetical protein